MLKYFVEKKKQSR